MFRIVLRSKPSTLNYSALTIGNFDGFHKGHVAILEKLNHISNQHGYKSIVILFEPSPREYFARKQKLSSDRKISLLRDQIYFLKELGYIDEVVLIRFNKNIENMTPEQFIETFLLKNLNAKSVIIGHDFKFGKDGNGCKKDFLNYGLSVCEVPPYKMANNIISSTLIRKLAKENNLLEVKQHLGRNICYSGRIVYGKQNGKKYNIPTINIDMGHKKPCLHGVYCVFVHINGIRYQGVANIGLNPTLEESKKYFLEVYLLDVNLNLYGKIATTEFIYFMRNELKFETIEELFTQMRQDILAAKSYFTKMLRNNVND